MLTLCKHKVHLPRNIP